MIGNDKQIQAHKVSLLKWGSEVREWQKVWT